MTENCLNLMRKLGGDPLTLYTMPSDREFQDAIEYAETGAYNKDGKGYWARTKRRPVLKNPKTGKWLDSSTAYGPYQLTGETARDFFTRYGKDLKPYESFYKTKMVPMYQNFAKHGMNQGKSWFNPVYDYGGTGDTMNMFDKATYRAMTGKIMSLQERDLGKMVKGYSNFTPQQKLMEKIKRWRGVKATEDPAYFNKVVTYLNKRNPQLFINQQVVQPNLVAQR